MVQLRSWMIPAEACPGTFVTLKGACGKTTTTKFVDSEFVKTCHEHVIQLDIRHFDELSLSLTLLFTNRFRGFLSHLQKLT
jgi:hypothetical protein